MHYQVAFVRIKLLLQKVSEMFAIAPTDQNWFDFLKYSELNSEINFWTPTPWNPKQFDYNARLYFMLKSPIRQIGGFGEFAEYKKLTARQAWNEFGYGNGCHSCDVLVDNIQSYIDKNSGVYHGQKIGIDTYEIGCIVLNNCEFWDNDEFIDAENFDISFAGNITKLKYFHEEDPFFNVENERENFVIVNNVRGDRRAEINIRAGQSGFKGKLLRAYNNRCCISGEIIPELLEAAHIQKYINAASHHVQNGLLLRADLHRLYDNGLLYIDENYIVHVSSIITSMRYRMYHKRRISLPNTAFNRPSKTALTLRKKDFRN